MMCLALKLLLCILADSQLFVGVRLIPFGSNLFPSGCRSPPSPPHPMRPPSCHTPAFHHHVITLLFPFPPFPLLSLSVCFMKKRIEFFFFFPKITYSAGFSVGRMWVLRRTKVTFVRHITRSRPTAKTSESVCFIQRF